MEVFVPREEIRSDAVLSLCDYWEKARGDLPIMPRERLDPRALGGLLPWLFFTEFEFHPFRVRYRIVGSEQARLAGADYSGAYLEDTHLSDDVKTFVTEAYRLMIKTRAPVFAIVGFEAMDGSEHRIDCCALPLGDAEGHCITHGLALEDMRGLEEGGFLSNSRDYENFARGRASTRPVRRLTLAKGSRRDF